MKILWEKFVIILLSNGIVKELRGFVDWLNVIKLIN